MPFRQTLPLAFLLVIVLSLDTVLHAQQPSSDRQVEWRVRYDREMWMQLDTTIPDTLFHSLHWFEDHVGDSALDTHGTMLFTVKLRATLDGRVHKVFILPIHDWSSTPRKHKSWKIGAALIKQKLLSARLFSLIDPNYRAPLTSEYLQTVYGADWRSQCLNPALIDQTYVEYVFIARIGVADPFPSDDMLNIGFFYR